MNTLHGNAVTTAEYAIALIFAAARNIPQASASTHAGKWEKTRFNGMELSGKTLLPARQNGSIVAQKALALGPKVMAYDPFYHQSGPQLGHCQKRATCAAGERRYRHLHVCKRRKPKRLSTLLR